MAVREQLLQMSEIVAQEGLVVLPAEVCRDSRSTWAGTGGLAQCGPIHPRVQTAEVHRFRRAVEQRSKGTTTRLMVPAGVEVR